MWSVSLDPGTADGKVRGTKVPSGKKYCTTMVRSPLSNDVVNLDFTLLPRFPAERYLYLWLFPNVSSHVCPLSIHVYFVYVYEGDKSDNRVELFASCLEEDQASERDDVAWEGRAMSGRSTACKISSLDTHQRSVAARSWIRRTAYSK
jgi:hypothetical protein